MKMKKRWIIGTGIILAIIILVFILRRSEKPAGNYMDAAKEIEDIVRKYESDENSETARRLIAEIQTIIDKTKQMDRREDDLVIVPVQADVVNYGCIEKKLTYLGDLEAESTARVYAKVPERIVEFPVRNGDYVKKGEPIARLDDSKFKEGVNQAEAALSSAKAQFKNVDYELRRIRSLFQEDAATGSQYQQLRTQYEVAKNGVKQAQAAYKTAVEQLEDMQIKAPISGYISGRMLNVGDMATAQMPLVTISEKDLLKIRVDAVENDLKYIKKEQNVNVFVDVYPHQVFNGEISRISPVVEPGSRTTQVDILLKNPDLKLKPGMYARIEVIIESKDNVLIVNKSNVDIKTSRDLNGGSIREAEIKHVYSVFKVRDSLAIYTPIKTGIQSGMEMEVLEGLNEKDLVVSMGRTNLRDSSMVDVVQVNE
jgi:membrane fusion protein, multidrug efflux system